MPFPASPLVFQPQSRTSQNSAHSGEKTHNIPCVTKSQLLPSNLSFLTQQRVVMSLALSAGLSYFFFSTLSSTHFGAWLSCLSHLISDTAMVSFLFSSFHCLKVFLPKKRSLTALPKTTSSHPYPFSLLCSSYYLFVIAELLGGNRRHFHEALFTCYGLGSGTRKGC